MEHVKQSTITIIVKCGVTNGKSNFKTKIIVKLNMFSYDSGAEAWSELSGVRVLNL